MDSKDLFEILVRENADMLIGYIRAAVRHDAAADDIFQETMLTAWRRLDDFDKSRPFAPWLRGIAAKVILSHFRTATRGGELSDQQTLEYLSARFDQLQLLQGDSIDDKLDALRDCVQRLPDPYRESITLRYREELRMKTIADRLGLAPEAV